MTATVAIQSVPAKAVASTESSVKAASTKSSNEVSNVENEGKSSFKDLYNDAKKVDNRTESETKKHDVNDAAGKEAFAEDGNSLPPKDGAGGTGNEKEALLNKQTMQLAEDSSQDLLIAQPLPSLSLDDAAANGDDMVVGITEPLKNRQLFSGIEKQPLDAVKGNNLSVLTGLNHAKLNIAIEEQDVQLAVNDKRLNDVPAIVPGASTHSLAQRLSLTKAGAGLANSGGLNETLNLSPGQLTDELMISDMDKAFSKALGADKLSLDAMLGKLDTLTNTAATSQKQSAVIPLSTALNYSPTALTQEFSGVSQTSITETLGKPEWNQSMSKQIVWMATQNIRSAEIKLTPANLGTIEVRVEMNEDKLNVAFSSRDAGVRDSVEQAMPKLREMMEEQGLDLGDTDVSEQTFFEQQEEGYSQQDNLAKAVRADSDLPDADSTSVDERLVQAVNTPVTAVDYYI